MTVTVRVTTWVVTADSVMTTLANPALSSTRRLPMPMFGITGGALGVSAGRLPVVPEATKPLWFSAGSEAVVAAAKLAAAGAAPEIGASEDPPEIVLPLKLPGVDIDVPTPALPLDGLVDVPPLAPGLAPGPVPADTPPPDATAPVPASGAWPLEDTRLVMTLAWAAEGASAARALAAAACSTMPSPATPTADPAPGCCTHTPSPWVPAAARAPIGSTVVSPLVVLTLTPTPCPRATTRPNGVSMLTPSPWLGEFSTAIAPATRRSETVDCSPASARISRFEWAPIVTDMGLSPLPRSLARVNSILTEPPSVSINRP